MTTHKQATAALRRAKGNKSAAARALGVTRNELRWALDAGAARAVKAAGPDHKALAKAEAKVDALTKALREERARKVPPPVKVRAGKAPKSIIRVIVPDSHGHHIDWTAAKAMVQDIARLRPDEVVYIGDHVDCGGTFSAHQRSYTYEMTESYADDVGSANTFLDMMRQAAPNSRDRYLQGNHEQHVERWAARNFASYGDAAFALDLLAPESVLKLKQRGIDYFKMSEKYDGLTTPGMIKLGKCHYTHGFQASEFATAAMQRRVGANLVHGHTHRAQAFFTGTTTSYVHGAWCFGTLAKLQPLYRHTAPSNWTQGYGVQFVNVGTGTFTTFMVPIFGDKTLLLETVDAVAARARP